MKSLASQTPRVYLQTSKSWCNGFFDYGEFGRPFGRTSRKLVERHGAPDDMVGRFHHHYAPNVWNASGHVDSFTDPWWIKESKMRYG